MSDYEPDYVYMIPLAYKTIENYYENITTVPAQIRGAFITDDETRDKIDFQIYSPSGKLVYSNSTNECIFNFPVNEIGRYRIDLNNRYLNREIKVTFTMNAHQNLMLKEKDLSFTDLKLESLISFLKRFNLEFRVNKNIHTERYKSKINLTVFNRNSKDK
jgi:hypothetical protein